MRGFDDPPNDLPPSDVPAGDPPAPQPTPAPAVDMDVLAQKTAEKMVEMLGVQAPPTATHTAAASELSTWAELQRQAGDPNDPRQAAAAGVLATMRRQGEEDEWNALGCPGGHPARALYASNPGLYSGRPVYAFREWENAELRKEAAEAKADKQKAEEAAAERGRQETPGMPSRSVGGTTGSGGIRSMPRSEFLRKLETEPNLGDEYDSGKLRLIPD